MDIFTLENLLTLGMLVLLQAVLGFDNLLYISIESKRVEPEEKQSFVRKFGIALAVILRIILLFVVVRAIEIFAQPLFSVHWDNYIHGEFNLHAVVVLFGGAFIIYTAIKEISHMLVVEDVTHANAGGRRSVFTAIFWIVSMNLVFSFDSILSAMALTDNFIVMATAIVISGILMILLADKVSDFLKKNRMVEVLGLFILLIVGVMLVSEGGHLAHLTLFGFPVEPMAKSTFYFVIAVIVLVDLVQSRYQKKLLAQRALEVGASA